MKNPHLFRNFARKNITYCGGFVLVLFDKANNKLIAFGEHAKGSTLPAVELNKMVDKLEQICFEANDELGDFVRIKSTSKHVSLKGEPKLDDKWMSLVPVVKDENKRRCKVTRKRVLGHGARRQLWDLAFAESRRKENEHVAKTVQLLKEASALGLVVDPAYEKALDIRPEVIQRDLSLGDLVSECSPGESVQPVRSRAVPQNCPGDVWQWYRENGRIR